MSPGLYDSVNYGDELMKKIGFDRTTSFFIKTVKQ